MPFIITITVEFLSHLPPSQLLLQLSSYLLESIYRSADDVRGESVPIHRAARLGMPRGFTLRGRAEGLGLHYPNLGVLHLHDVVTAERGVKSSSDLLNSQVQSLGHVISHKRWYHGSPLLSAGRDKPHYGCEVGTSLPCSRHHRRTCRTNILKSAHGVVWKLRKMASPTASLKRAGLKGENPGGALEDPGTET